MTGCGTCNPCHNGQYHFCSEGGINDTIGLFHDGGWSEFCAVPAEQVYKLPQNINLKQGERMDN
uniref:Alcohol dehydrogenase-like N-terminal domain-containing protein n=1 Tax=Timema shepardi TaxID=629360 RepID=A0A7R9BBN9_TIMSH|nr:unnamed protein product [Timema shepardi]